VKTTTHGTVRTVAGCRTPASRTAAALLTLGILAACRDAGAPAAGPPPSREPAATPASPAPDTASGSAAATRDTTVRIHFSRGDSAVPVERTVVAENAGLETSLELLLRGPTAAERRAGLTSWFSDATAGALRSVTVRGDTAVVNLADLRALIPNASSSAGSAMLLRELNATVFQDPAIRAVEYRMEGSCAAFWEWLQYGCRIVSRP
jgi:hypothetical protein